MYVRTNKHNYPIKKQIIHLVEQVRICYTRKPDTDCNINVTTSQEENQADSSNHHSQRQSACTQHSKHSLLYIPNNMDSELTLFNTLHSNCVNWGRLYLQFYGWDRLNYTVKMTFTFIVDFF